MWNITFMTCQRHLISMKFKSRHHDIALMSMSMTDTFCSFFEKYHFHDLPPFVKGILSQWRLIKVKLHQEFNSLTFSYFTDINKMQPRCHWGKVSYRIPHQSIYIGYLYPMNLDLRCMYVLLKAANTQERNYSCLFKPAKCLIKSETGGIISKTDPDQIAIVIRVKLFIHKPCRQKTSVTWSCMSNDAVSICICLTGLEGE